MPDLSAQRGYEIRSRLRDQKSSLEQLRREVDYLEKRLDRMEKNTRRRFDRTCTYTDLFFYLYVVVGLLTVLVIALWPVVAGP